MPGIPLFMGVLAEVGWITMDDGTLAHRIAAGAISVIALLSGLIFYAYTYRKWGPFLSNLKLDLHNIQPEPSQEVVGEGIPAYTDLVYEPAAAPGARATSGGRGPVPPLRSWENSWR